ncbi:MAG: hypothetical protein RLQ12_12075 [Cyclobacteriaceae bacterium]
MNRSFAANNSGPGEDFFLIGAKSIDPSSKKLRFRIEKLLAASKMLRLQNIFAPRMQLKDSTLQLIAP